MYISDILPKSFRHIDDSSFIIQIVESLFDIGCSRVDSTMLHRLISFVLLHERSSGVSLLNLPSDLARDVAATQLGYALLFIVYYFVVMELLHLPLFYIYSSTQSCFLKLLYTNRRCHLLLCIVCTTLL
jgi:hypothetical protein